MPACIPIHFLVIVSSESERNQYCFVITHVAFLSDSFQKAMLALIQLCRNSLCVLTQLQAMLLLTLQCMFL